MAGMTSNSSGKGGHMGIFSAVMMLVGAIIGSGIFASPGPLLTMTGSVGMSLLVWLAAGLLSMIGAFCYAELGTMITENGGEYQYLRTAFGPLLGLTYTWSLIMLANPIGTASIAFIFARYMCHVFYMDPSGDPSKSHDAPDYLVKLVACIGIAVVAILQCISSRAGTRVATLFTSAKVVAIAVIVIVGLVWMGKGEVGEGFARPIMEGTKSDPMSLGKAMCMALFAYNGWNTLNFATGELKNPARVLPWAIAISCTVVIVCYQLANVAYLSVLPLETVRTSKTVAMELGLKAMGPGGAYFMAAMVCCSAFGAVNAHVWVASHLLLASAKDGILFPKIFARIHEGRGTPMINLAFVTVISCLWTLVGDFDKLVKVYAFILWAFYFTTILGMMVLRWKAPTRERPFRVWWPLAAVFLLVAGYVVVAPLADAKDLILQYTLCILGCLCAVPIWYWRVRRPANRELAMKETDGAYKMASEKV
ncbi:MAG: amino acid/polyamine transporter I [Piptocephalis tieghemiana]|nr:MAG: amino acid/polyamine transporter I [Piptocephalis tieghemiana]